MFRTMHMCCRGTDVDFAQLCPYSAWQTKTILLLSCPVSCTRDVSGALTSLLWDSSSQRQERSVGWCSAGSNQNPLMIIIWCVATPAHFLFCKEQLLIAYTANCSHRPCIHGHRI